MSTFKRFIDNVTGRFTQSRDPATTTKIDVGGLSAGKRKILSNALEDEKLASSPYMANKVLRDAIEKVLG